MSNHQTTREIRAITTGSAVLGVMTIWVFGMVQNFFPETFNVNMLFYIYSFIGAVFFVSVIHAVKLNARYTQELICKIHNVDLLIACDCKECEKKRS